MPPLTIRLFVWYFCIPAGIHFCFSYRVHKCIKPELCIIKFYILLFIYPIQFLFTFSYIYAYMFSCDILLGSYSSSFNLPEDGNLVIFSDYICMFNSIVYMYIIDTILSYYIVLI